jgi:hypothetical protein
MQNSQSPVHASFDITKDDQNYNPGLTKAEYATIQFVAAHFSAHGKYPDPTQTEALADFALWILDFVTPKVADRNYGLPRDLNPMSQLEDLE